MYQDFYPNIPPRRGLSREELTKTGRRIRRRARLADACLLLVIAAPGIGVYFQLVY